jgi:hypothetical protein
MLLERRSISFSALPNQKKRNKVNLKKQKGIY